MSYLVNKLHATVFARYDLSDSLEFARNARRAKAEVLDGEPLILPIPDDAPSDTPRVFLKSKDERYSCGFAPDELQVSFSEPGLPHYRLEESKAGFIDLLDAQVSNAMLSAKGDIRHMHFVVELVALQNDPVQILKTMYIKEQLLGRPTELIVGFSNEMVWDDIEIRMRCAINAGESYTDAGEKKETIGVQFTMLTDMKNMSKERAIALVDRAFTYISNSIDSIAPQLSE